MKRLILMLLLGTICQFAWAQQVLKIKGSVTDGNNNPLIGATVTVQGANKATATNQNGQFEIEASKGQTLVVSYTGMNAAEVVVNNGNDLAVTLQPAANQMEEVVIVGYGTVKRKDLTGAIASVTGGDIQANLAKSTAGALQGRIAGVSVGNAGGQPGAGMSINIRGLSSLGSNAPLYVIDGVYGDINLVDPSDIASIQVLKDASAAAIYGSRAANGVVLVTTKGGHKNSPAVISLNAYTGWQKITKKLDVMNAQQWKGIMQSTGYLPPAAISFQGNGTNWQDEIYQDRKSVV